MPLNIGQSLLNMMEGLSSIKITVKAVSPVSKKKAKFIYFSIFNMKNRISKRGKPSVGQAYQPSEEDSVYIKINCRLIVEKL